jgi:hypothetical protein
MTSRQGRKRHSSRRQAIDRQTSKLTEQLIHESHIQSTGDDGQQSSPIEWTILWNP